jgi:hypothetical protein
MDAFSQLGEIASMRLDKRTRRRRAGISGWMLFASTKAQQKKKAIK